MYSWIEAHDPPDRISNQSESLVRVEPLDRQHESDVALGNELAKRQAVAAVVSMRS